MIRNRTFVSTDCYRKELQEQGLQLFNMYANEGDIHQYIADCIPSHWHRELEVFLLLQGSVIIQIGDNIYHAEAGEGYFINTGVLHSFAAAVPSPCIYHSFVFDSGIIGGTPGSVFDTMYVRPLLDAGPDFLKFQKEAGDEAFFQQFDTAFTACEKEKSGYEFEVREALSKILLYTKEKHQTMPSRRMPTLQESRLKQMLEWIDGNLRSVMTVKEIADTANICTRECQRIFSRYLHYSPMEYIQQRRLFKAAEQLSTTDAPITEIAFDCGFSSHSYFTKQFKALVGATPTEYRAAIQENRSKTPF
ncbi:AraC family transcriptional regulator [Lacrimispora amygdalina]|uniref:AraC family transcriptional regulator n=1 Tax=Lacrimispora amygdalina TaxID=253257 RepID=A0A3E2NCK0_9FIRM|nr:AraC family transcriptional regulator [Clostridium indicum]RFZ78621.1 AraC family transcriptional regulator [Clostridium indicum]